MNSYLLSSCTPLKSNMFIMSAGKYVNKKATNKAIKSIVTLISFLCIFNTCFSKHLPRCVFINFRALLTVPPYKNTTTENVTATIPHNINVKYNSNIFLTAVEVKYHVCASITISVDNLHIKIIALVTRPLVTTCRCINGLETEKYRSKARSVILKRLVINDKQ